MPESRESVSVVQTPINTSLIDEMLALHKQERLPHAILLIAPFGFALRSNAGAIAKSLLCQERVVNGCGQVLPAVCARRFCVSEIMTHLAVSAVVVVAYQAVRTVIIAGWRSPRGKQASVWIR